MYFVSSRCLFPMAHSQQQNTGWWFICGHHTRHVTLVISHKGTEACSSLQKHEITCCTNSYTFPFPHIPDRSFEIRSVSVHLIEDLSLHVYECLHVLTRDINSNCTWVQKRFFRDSSNQINQLWDGSHYTLCLKVKNWRNINYLITT